MKKARLSNTFLGPSGILMKKVNGSALCSTSSKDPTYQNICDISPSFNKNNNLQNSAMSDYQNNKTFGIKQQSNYVFSQNFPSKNNNIWESWKQMNENIFNQYDIAKERNGVRCEYDKVLQNTNILDSRSEEGSKNHKMVRALSKCYLTVTCQKLDKKTISFYKRISNKNDKISSQTSASQLTMNKKVTEIVETFSAFTAGCSGEQEKELSATEVNNPFAADTSNTKMDSPPEKEMASASNYKYISADKTDNGQEGHFVNKHRISKGRKNSPSQNQPPNSSEPNEDIFSAPVHSADANEEMLTSDLASDTNCVVNETDKSTGTQHVEKQKTKDTLRRSVVTRSMAKYPLNKQNENESKKCDPKEQTRSENNKCGVKEQNESEECNLREQNQSKNQESNLNQQNESKNQESNLNQHNESKNKECIFNQQNERESEPMSLAEEFVSKLININLEQSEFSLDSLNKNKINNDTKDESFSGSRRVRETVKTDEEIKIIKVTSADKKVKRLGRRRRKKHKKDGNSNRKGEEKQSVNELKKCLDMLRSHMKTNESSVPELNNSETIVIDDNENSEAPNPETSETNRKTEESQKPVTEILNTSNDSPVNENDAKIVKKSLCLMNKKEKNNIWKKSSIKEIKPPSKSKGRPRNNLSEKTKKNTETKTADGNENEMKPPEQETDKKTSACPPTQTTSSEVGKMETSEVGKSLRVRFNIVSGSDIVKCRMRLRSCSYCQTFRTRLAVVLKDHVKKMHKFRCAACHLVFQNMKAVRAHRKFFHQMEEHHCVQCHKIFPSCSACKTHSKSRKHSDLLQTRRNMFNEMISIISISNPEIKDVLEDDSLTDNTGYITGLKNNLSDNNNNNLDSFDITTASSTKLTTVTNLPAMTGKGKKTFENKHCYHYTPLDNKIKKLDIYLQKHKDICKQDSLQNAFNILDFSPDILINGSSQTRDPVDTSENNDSIDLDASFVEELAKAVLNSDLDSNQQFGTNFGTDFSTEESDQNEKSKCSSFMTLLTQDETNVNTSEARDTSRTEQFQRPQSVPEHERSDADMVSPDAGSSSGLVIVNTYSLNGQARNNFTQMNTSEDADLQQVCGRFEQITYGQRLDESSSAGQSQLGCSGIYPNPQFQGTSAYPDTRSQVTATYLSAQSQGSYPCSLGTSLSSACQVPMDLQVTDQNQSESADQIPSFIPKEYARGDNDKEKNGEEIKAELFNLLLEIEKNERELEERQKGVTKSPIQLL